MARREKVLVSLSGGPASAIAASLLRNQDFDLIAVYGKITHSERLPASHCCPVRDESLVVRLCEKLSIPLIIEDLTSAVEGRVIAPLIEARLQGKMLDPCIKFHSEVLLPKLWEVAQRSRATLIATGHFARLSQDRDSGEITLGATTDPLSDQSALLSRAPAEVLKHLQLPLSAIPETMMKKLAEELKLDLAARHSENGGGIDAWPSSCFPEEMFQQSLIHRYAAPKFSSPGAVRSVEEYTSGEHSGVWEARVGKESRHMSGQTVLAITPGTHTILVGFEERLKLKNWDLHSVQLRRATKGLKAIQIQARIADQAGLREGSLALFSGGYGVLSFSEPLRHPSPGQMLVFYDQNEIVGSAICGETPVKTEGK